MDQRLKRRLVGASVVVLVVVIFVPELFDQGTSDEASDRAMETDNGEFNSRIIPIEKRRGGDVGRQRHQRCFSSDGGASG